MRNVLHLIRRDMRAVASNVIAAVVIFGLIIIPSLFTWFNVLATWDPFANTKNLQVAVASSDEGYESNLLPIRINVGEQVLSALRANDQLDWVITSPEDAVDGTRSGEYYGALVLPESFSTDILTFYSDGGERIGLDYYTNEKKNPIAPKITDQGAEGVSEQISETFTDTLSDISLSLISSLSDFLTDGETQAALARIDAQVGAVATQLRSGAQTAEMFGALAQSTIPLLDGASGLISASGAALGDARDAGESGAGAAQSLGSTVQSSAAALSDAISSTADGYGALGTTIDEVLSTAGTLGDTQAEALSTLADRVQQQIDGYTAVRNTLDTQIRPILPPVAQPALDDVSSRIDNAISRQQSVHDSLLSASRTLADGDASGPTAFDELTSTVDEARGLIRSAEDSYNSELRPQLESLAGTLNAIDSDITAIGDDLSGATERLSSSSGSVGETLANVQQAMQDVAGSLNEAAGTFDRVQEALASARDTGDLTELRSIIGSDPSVLAAALAEPVAVERTAVFPITSFGAGLTPLYLMLALWVGALLATLAVRTDIKRDDVPELPDLTPTQAYLGRYGIVALIGLAQSTLVTVGLILFVEVDPVHPVLFVLAGWVTGLVFSLMTYTFVASFGSAGKALSVLMLVIQISSAGGAYPLQLLPQWFQTISTFLPGTHSVNAIRSAIAGIYDHDYWVSLGLLSAFIIPMLLLGLVLRRPLMSYNRKTAEALESTKLVS